MEDSTTLNGSLAICIAARYKDAATGYFVRVSIKLYEFPNRAAWLINRRSFSIRPTTS